jgi:hypothetical protein
VAANPRIQKLGRELMGLYMADGITCGEDTRRRRCDRTPEYRCELGPFTEGVGVRNVSKDLCSEHAKRFAKLFKLRLPTKVLAR